MYFIAIRYAAKDAARAARMFLFWDSSISSSRSSGGRFVSFAYIVLTAELSQYVADTNETTATRTSTISSETFPNNHARERSKFVGVASRSASDSFRSRRWRYQILLPHQVRPYVQVFRVRRGHAVLYLRGMRPVHVGRGSCTADGDQCGMRRHWREHGGKSLPNR